jgi:hypothetical protein
MSKDFFRIWGRGMIYETSQTTRIPSLYILEPQN